MISVRNYNEADRQLWDAYAMKSAGSSLYHLTAWKDVIEKTFGHKTYYLIAEDRKGNAAGVLPMVHLKSIYFGNFLVSLPYFNYGGVCADSTEARDMLVEAAINTGKTLGVRHLELRHSANHDMGLPVKSAKVSMLLELPGSAKELLDSFPSKLRSQVKKPEKEGLKARVGGIEEFESFYSVFSTNMRDLGTPVYPKAFFKNILERLPGSSWIATVYMKDIPVASGFLAGFRGTIEIPWASALREYNRLSPNMLLYWTVLKFAVDNGWRVFDFGRSTPGEGTYKFKQQWGAAPLPLFWHYWVRDNGPVPEINPKNPKFSLAINIWKRLPVGLTNIIGPGIVKNLP